MTASVRIAAPAKINLFLKIVGRRADGYHNLGSLMQKVELYDRITLHKATGGITLTCPGSKLPTGEENIAHRAARLFMEEFSAACPKDECGVEIVLEKKIPIAAGLGGGSSDAAAVLRGMEQLFVPEGCPAADLHRLAVHLGADVPFFLNTAAAAWATGIGDRLTEAVPLSDMTVVLVNPGIPVSTQWVYENFALTLQEKKFNLKNFNIDAPPFIQRAIRMDELWNDLEEVTAGHHSEIREIEQQLLEGGASAVMMSGSGPTVFGLFEEKSGQNTRLGKYCSLLRDRYEHVYEVRPCSSTN